MRRDGPGAVLATRGDNGLLIEMTPGHPNACLLEAAPDLLAACENGLDTILDLIANSGGEQSMSDWANEINVLRAAISKARGGK
jgi:hypothetical protein